MKKAISTSLAFSLLLSSSFVSTSFAKNDKERRVHVKYSLTDSRYGTPSYMSGDLTLPSNESPEVLVKKYIGNDKSNADYIIRKQYKNPEEQTIVKTQQTYNGIKVRGAQQSYIVDKDGVITSIAGTSIPDIGDKINNSVLLSEADALEIVKKDLKRDLNNAKSSNAEKLILPQPKEAVYAYSIKVSFEYPCVESWEYLINASTGKVIQKKDALIYESLPVDGKGFFGDTKTMIGYKGTIPDVNIVPQYPYSLADVSKVAPTGATPRAMKVLTYELTSTSPLNINGSKSIVSDNDGHFIEDSSKASAVDAHYFGEKAYDFYKSFGRYSYDNAGADIINNTHATFGGGDKNNACWDPASKQLYFGDGDGVEYTSFASEVDATGHELTHAVIDSEAPYLDYYGEMGSVNEGLADLFGEAFEAYTKGTNPDWMKIKECYTPNIAGDAYLDFKNPQLCTGMPNGYPDHMGNKYLGSDDNNGVHINAAILTKAFSLMSDGGNFQNVTVSGIGIGKLSNIMYKVVNESLTNNTNFGELALASLNAAEVLYGQASAEYKAVQSGFQAVGILNNISQWKQISESGQAVGDGSAAVCQVGNKVYSVGGSKFFKDTFSNEVWEYSIDSNKWLKKNNLSKNRAYASATSDNNNAYVMFGCSNWDFTGYYTSVDQYNPTTDQWDSVANLPEKPIVYLAPYPAGTVKINAVTSRDSWLVVKTGVLPTGASVEVKLQGSNDNINFVDCVNFGSISTSYANKEFAWVSGHYNKKYYRVVATAKGGTCSFEINAPAIREGSSLVYYNNKIYVIGGSNYELNTISTMDIYDIATKEWTTDLPGVSYGRRIPTTVVTNINNQPKIYVFFGGSTNIEVYDINTGTWNHSAGIVPADINCTNSSAVMYKNKIHFSSQSRGDNDGATVIYDPVTNIWTKDTSMGCYTHTGSLSFVYNNSLYTIGTFDLDACSKTSKYDPLRISAFENNNNILVRWSKFNNSPNTLTIDGVTTYTGANNSYTYSSFNNTSKKHLIKVLQNHQVYGNTNSKNLCTVYQKIGDVDGNNLINAVDATLVKNYILSISTLSNLQKVAADINKDGNVDSADNLLLSRYVNNNISYPTIGSTTFMIYGDVTSDGDVDMDDYEKVSNYISSGAPLTISQIVKADVDGNGVVNSTDLTTIKNYMEQDNIVFPVMN